LRKNAGEDAATREKVCELYFTGDQRERAFENMGSDKSRSTREKRQHGTPED